LGRELVTFPSGGNAGACGVNRLVGGFATNPSRTGRPVKRRHQGVALGFSVRHDYRDMSSTVKKAGHKAVVDYEAERGRVATVHEKDGYDIISEGNGETRHIEVKSTDSQRFVWRALTEAEFRAAVSDPLFYLYLVTDASGSPKITELRRDDLLLRYRGTVVQHIISFPKSLEAGGVTQA
jgi:hypothetical protein